MTNFCGVIFLAMQKKSISLVEFIYGASLISLLPFVVFFFVTIPCSDDIFYHNFAQERTTWGFLMEHYMTWTGRYFSNLMMAINPYTLTSKAGVYPLMMVSLFFVFTASLYYLIKAVFKILNPYQSSGAYATEASYNAPIKKAAFFAMTIFTALFLHKMPRTTDSLYWFAGASSHLLPMSLILCAVGLYFSRLNFLVTAPSLSLTKELASSAAATSARSPYFYQTILSIIAISLISFIVSGSNETLAIQWIFTLMFGLFYKKIIFKRWDWTLFLPLLVALSGFAILYFAPGNAIRAKELKGGHDIILLLFKPWGLIAETSVRYLSLSLLVALVCFFPIFKKLNQNLPLFLKESRSRVLLALFGLGLFALTFVPSVWTMGGLPPRRVLNNMYLIFLLYGSFLLIVSAHTLNRVDLWIEFLSKRLSTRQWKFIFLVGLVFFFNNFYAWKDLFNLPSFLNSVQQRDRLVASARNTDLVIEPLAYFPTTFFYEDITVKTDDYRNIVFSEFYKLKTVRLSKNYND